jgi:predicted amidohydrolase YtcJ
MVDSADLILLGGKITTLNKGQPEAQAVAIRDGRFLAVGDNRFIKSFAGPSTRIIELGGRRVLPGLIDNHLHIIRGGLNFNLELRWDGVRSLADAMAMLKAQVAITPRRNGCAWWAASAINSSLRSAFPRKRS